MRFALILLAPLVVAVVALAKPGPPPVETHVVDTGPAPCGAAVSRGRVWVGVYETGKLLRLDADSGRVTHRISVGSWACRVAVGPAAVWVTRDRAGELVRISPGSGRRHRVPVGRGAFDVLLAHGSLWATSFDIGTIARMEPVAGKLQRVFRVGPNPAGLVACAGRIWVGHGRSATWISSIDPRTLRIGRIELEARAPGWPSCIRQELWLTTPDSVLRVSPRTGKVLSRLRLGETLAEAAQGPDGLVWVTDKQHSVVHRLAPDGSSVVDSFRAGPGAFSLARSGEAMWITSFAGADVRRYTR